MIERDLAMFPLGMVIFPHQRVNLCVFEPRYHQLLADVAEDQRFGTCLIARGSDVGGSDERTAVGTLVEILGTHHLDNGQVLVAVEGVECFAITHWLSDSPYPRARVERRCCDDVAIEPVLLRSTESAVRALRTLQSEIVADQRLERNCLMDDDPTVRNWQLCALSPMSVLDQFTVLSLSNPNERMRLLAEVCCERYGDFQRQLALDELSSGLL